MPEVPSDRVHDALRAYVVGSKVHYKPGGQREPSGTVSVGLELGLELEVGLGLTTAVSR